MKEDLCVSESVYFPKCQPKDTIFLFKLCFTCVPATTLLYMFAYYFIYASHSNSQGQPKFPSFSATAVDLHTILHGCYLEGRNIMSASQSIATRNHRTTKTAHCSPAASSTAAWRMAAGCMGNAWAPEGKSVVEPGWTPQCIKLILQRPWQYWHLLLLL